MGPGMMAQSMAPVQAVLLSFGASMGERARLRMGIGLQDVRV